MDNNKKSLKRLWQQLPLKVVRREQNQPRSRAESVRRWVESLPRANARDTALQLKPALEEMNRVERDPLYRLDALDAVRPTVYMALRGLEKQYLGQSLKPGAQATEALALCDKLNHLLTTGYWKAATGLSDQCESRANPALPINPFEDTAVVNDSATSDDGEQEQTRQALAKALHRALTEHSRILLRRYQLYGEPPKALWQKLYQMFMFANRKQLASLKIDDTVLGDCSLKHSFLRTLLFAAAQPQRLMQADMEALFQLLGPLEGLAELTAANADSASLLFRLTDATAPAAATHWSQRKGCMGIDTRALCQHLQTLAETADDATDSSDEKKPLPGHVLRQLQQCWQGELTLAALDTVAGTPAQLVLGLPASHFFAAGQTPFAAFVEELRANESEEEAVAESPSADVWSKSRSRDARVKEARPGRFAHQQLDFESPLDRYREGDGAGFPRYPVLMSRRDGHFSLQWRNGESVHPRIGNVVAVRDPDAAGWSAGLLRSIRRLNSEASLLDIEVLADNIQPFCAQVLEAGLPVGRAQRALLFAQGENWEGGLQLLCPAASFGGGQSLRLTQPGQAPLCIKLQDALTATQACQFFSCQLLRIEKRPLGQEAVEKADTAAQSGGLNRR